LSYCCGSDTDSELGDAGERTRLISDHSPQQTLIPELIQDNGRNLPYPSSLPKVNDEQNALKNIQQALAVDVIDISAIDHMPAIEHNDYVEKSTLYSKRLANVGAALATKHARPVAVVETPASDVNKVVTEEPIQQEDLALITEVALRAEKEISEFKIEHQEDLVANFGER